MAKPDLSLILLTNTFDDWRQEFNEAVGLINGELVDTALAGLNTTTSTSLIAAINEVNSGKLNLAGGTMTGEVDFDNNLLSKAQIKDYREELVSIGNMGATQTFDLSQGNVFTATLDQNCAITFTGAAADAAYSFTMYLTNGGAFTPTWPASVDWPSGVAPTLTTAGVDILGFSTVDGGTTWHGVLGQKDSS